MFMKRTMCLNCHYPQSVCICDALCTVTSAQKVIILQHPSEVKHAKSSVKLIRLCVPNSEIWIGETPGDFAQLIINLKTQRNQVCVIYPNQNSVPLESINEKQNSNITSIILLDATWRKAYKIWQLNPWLQHLPSWHFAIPPQSEYKIRKTSVSSGLSTLEALAHTLYITQGLDKAPLLTTFTRMQQRVFAQHLSNP